MSLDDQLVAMSETQPWKFFALQGLNFQFLELNFQFLEGNFKMSEPCVFNLILWVLYTGMQWKSLPIPHDAQGKPAIHYTTIYKVFAKWVDDGSLWQAFVASVRHLAAEKQLDLSVLHGDGTNTVAKKGAMASAIPATSTKRVTKSLPSLTIMATS